MKCQRCLRSEAAYRVHTDAMDMKVCAACADEARRLGIAAKILDEHLREMNKSGIDFRNILKQAG